MDYYVIPLLFFFFLELLDKFACRANKIVLRKQTKRRTIADGAPPELYSLPLQDDQQTAPVRKRKITAKAKASLVQETEFSPKKKPQPAPTKVKPSKTIKVTEKTAEEKASFSTMSTMLEQFSDTDDSSSFSSSSHNTMSSPGPIHATSTTTANIDTVMPRTSTQPIPTTTSTTTANIDTVMPRTSTQPIPPTTSTTTANIDTVMPRTSTQPIPPTTNFQSNTAASSISSTSFNSNLSTSSIFSTESIFQTLPTSTTSFYDNMSSHYNPRTPIRPTPILSQSSCFIPGAANYDFSGYQQHQDSRLLDTWNLCHQPQIPGN